MFIVHKRIQGYLLKANSPLRPQRWLSDHQNDTMLPSLLLLVYEVLIIVFYLFVQLGKDRPSKVRKCFWLEENRQKTPL